MAREHKRKSYFTVPNAIWQDDLTVEERGIVVGLIGYMCERWATDKLTAKEGARVVLRPGVLAEITGRGTWKSGLVALERALENTSAKVSVKGRLLEGAAGAPGRRSHGSRQALDRRNVIVEWPKVSILQRFDRLSAPQSSSASAEASSSSQVPPKSPATRTPKTSKKAAAKDPKIAIPPLADWPREACESICRERGCTADHLRHAIGRVIEWHTNGETKNARVKRTVALWQRYLLKQEWPYEHFQSGTNGAARGPKETASDRARQIIKDRKRTESDSRFENAKELNS